MPRCVRYNGVSVSPLRRQSSHRAKSPRTTAGPASDRLRQLERREDAMQTYPVSLVLEGRAVVVVGGGAVATRKVEGLLPTGATIAVVSPDVSDRLAEHIQARRCAWRARTYEAHDLDDADIVFVATDDEAVNAQVHADACAAHLMVNVADRPELCTFFLPSVLRRGKLSVAVSTEGASPLTARRLRRQLEKLVPEEFEDYLDLLASWRPRAIDALPDEPTRLRFWEQATDGRVQTLLEQGEAKAAGQLLERLLEETRGLV